MEVRFENLEASASVFVGNRALPSVTNAFRNGAEVLHTAPLPEHGDTTGWICTQATSHADMVRLRAQYLLAKIGIRLASKRKMEILKNINGILHPVCASHSAY